MHSTDAGGAPQSTQDQHASSGVEEQPHKWTLDPAYDDAARVVDSSSDERKHEPVRRGSRGDENTSHPSAQPNPQLVSVRIESTSSALQTLKRKRGTSPPWHFPIADLSTIKTSDGRRSSARFNASASNTPGLSESESQGRRQSRATSSRLPSPPWKEFKAEGPSSVQIDGVRKSGRVNNLNATPTRVSPRSRKQTHTLVASQSREVGQTRAKLGRPDATLETIRAVKRARKPSSVIRELEAQIEELRPRKHTQQHNKRHASRHRRESSATAAATGYDEPVNHNTPATSPERLRRAKYRAPDLPKPSPRITIRLSSTRHALNPPHPHAVFPAPIHPPHPSLWQLIEDVELREMQQPYSENERGPPSREEFDRRHDKAAEQEMLLRQKIIEAGKEDGVLGTQRCSIYDDVTFQPEPAKQYSHVDHLANHASYLRSLQIKEQAAHRQLAKRIANEALEYWKKKQGPTKEDLDAEAVKMIRLVAKQVVADMKAKWDLVWQHVDARRRAVWEAEQEKRRQEKLEKQLAWSQLMIAKQRGQLGSEHDGSMQDYTSLMDEDSENDGDDDLDGSSDVSDDEDENMSDDESASSEDASLGADDESLDEAALRSYLAQREAEPPDKSQRSRPIEDESTLVDGSPMHSEGSEQSQATSPAAEGNLSAAKLDDLDGRVPARYPLETRTATAGDESANFELDGDDTSDESVDMDSEEYSNESADYESDEDLASESDGSGGSDMAGQSSGLLGFFSKSDRMAKGLPTPVTSAEGEHVTERDDDRKIALDAELHREHDVVSVTTKDQDATEGRDSMEAASHPSVSSLQRLDTPTSQAASDAFGKQLVPQPALLRGTLRSYQHAGLDWLASLYRNNTNGILADEMGLGKTIQTISLFAHIAEHHNVWDTHLVIVPTSVILNWVTEFQKFLPGFRVLGYYGSGEERQAKRRFWTNDPHHENRDKRGYNVIVTSYNIALKDITSLRTVQWHYMVLDEAHNIRNFNSQRFQNLIRLKTRARLLLTGTPLQNSLTELWSLLTFLTAGRDADDGAAHGSLEEFLARWKEPVNEIFDRGVQSLSDEAAKVVAQLHTSLRPFMLRRLKADVEKDLPKKTEHTVVCKLSKRQRELYQDYMGLADTRAKLTQGNAISAGKVLLSLRRVCNHPDLFDPRPVQTSYSLEKSPLEQSFIHGELVRQRLTMEMHHVPDMFRLTALEADLGYLRKRGKQLSARYAMQRQVQSLEHDISRAQPDLSTISGCQMMLLVQQKRRQISRLRDQIRYTDEYYTAKPIYGSDLRELLTVRSTRNTSGYTALGHMHIDTVDTTSPATRPTKALATTDKLIAKHSTIHDSITTVNRRAQSMHDIVEKFSFCTPEVVSPILEYLIPEPIQKILRANHNYPDSYDPAHEVRTRLNINFPDARLLVYDSGKLQRLTVLLRDLQSRGSRSLIFTQMSGTLNILEQFLGLMGLPYLRLDGSTPVERRQLYSAEFNRSDSKYQCMILSSRAGGVGLNLTGASSVIFYDLDWNPQMDRQCMDRAHRIGQVRDVEVYKMVSEKTVEENILRRANQKSLLDQTVIQEGRFTTDYDVPQQDKAAQDDDVTAAIDRFLSGPDKTFSKTIESVEDKEDVQAAQQARKEDMQDEEDFAERSSKGPSMPQTPNGEADDVDMEGHIDSYMIRYLEEAIKHIPYVPPVVPTRDPGHRKRKRARR